MIRRGAQEEPLPWPDEPPDRTPRHRDGGRDRRRDRAHRRAGPRDPRGRQAPAAGLDARGDRPADPGGRDRAGGAVPHRADPDRVGGLRDLGAGAVHGLRRSTTAAPGAPGCGGSCAASTTPTSSCSSPAATRRSRCCCSQGTERCVLLSVVWTGAAAGRGRSGSSGTTPRAGSTPRLHRPGLGGGVLPRRLRADREHRGARADGRRRRRSTPSAASSTASSGPNPFPRWFGFHEVFHALTIVAFVVALRRRLDRDVLAALSGPPHRATGVLGHPRLVLRRRPVTRPRIDPSDPALQKCVDEYPHRAPTAPSDDRPASLGPSRPPGSDRQAGPPTAGPRMPRTGLSLAQTVGGSLAAATAAFLGSHLGLGAAPSAVPPWPA